MADFGARLREARERKGLSLGQIAKTTKISPASLEALERNDLSRLPGGIFIRSFVRTYAREVGLDPGETLQQFLAQFEEPGDAPGIPAVQTSAVPARSHERVAVDDEVEFESRQKMASVVLKLVLISLPIAIAVIYINSRAASPAPQVEDASPPAENAASMPDIPVGDPAAPDASVPAEIPATSPTAGSAPARSSYDRSMAEHTEAIAIEIAPTADCWVQLTIDGVVAVSRIVPQGDRELHRFTDEAVLQVGDAAACTTFLNGRATRPLGRPRQVRTVTITRDNYPALIR